MTENSITCFHTTSIPSISEMAQAPNDTRDVECLVCEKKAQEHELFYCKQCNNNKIFCDSCGEHSHKVANKKHWADGKISLKLEGKLPANMVISRYYASTIEESQTALWKTGLKTGIAGAMLVPVVEHIAISAAKKLVEGGLQKGGEAAFKAALEKAFKTYGKAAAKKALEATLEEGGKNGLRKVGEAALKEFGKAGVKEGSKLSLGSIFVGAIGPAFVSILMFFYETHVLASKCDKDSDAYKRGVKASKTRNLAGFLGSLAGGTIGCAAGPWCGVVLAPIVGTACQSLAERVFESYWPKEVCLYNFEYILYCILFISLWYFNCV